MSVVVSLILVGIDDALTSALLQIDFSAVVMQGMLAVLIPPVVDLTLAGVAQRVEHA